MPALVMCATLKDEMRKPNPGMWDHMAQLQGGLNGGLVPDKAASFFVGDAAGRPTDFRDSETNAPAETDKAFARNVGIGFK